MADNFLTTPNMHLRLPIPGQDPGPDYALDLNASLSTVDAHDHAAGNGVQINASGININTDFTLNSNNLIGIRSLRLVDQTSPIALGTDLACLYNSDGDLYYNDADGNQIQMTQNGGIAGTNGSIANLTSPASASYVSGSTKFVWQSAANVAAIMDFRSAIFRNSGASAFGITVQSPALAGNYTITWPALPGQQNALTIDASGNMSSVTWDTIAGNITSTGADAIAADMTATGADAIAATMSATGANAIAATMTATGANAILADVSSVAATQANMVGNAMTSSGANGVATQRTRPVSSVVSGGVAVSTGSGSYTNSTGTPSTICSVGFQVSAGGRPVFFGLFGIDGTTSSSIVLNASTTAQVKFYLLRDSTEIGRITFSGSSTFNQIFSPTVVSAIDTGVAANGSYTYSVQGVVTSGTCTLGVNTARLVVYEL